MLDGGLIKEANDCSQWFLSLNSVASGLEKPLLTGQDSVLSSSAPTPLQSCCAARPYSQWHADHRPTSLSSFALTFKMRCLYLFTGICGTWMHRFAFWKFYLKDGWITSFRTALRSVRMDVWKHWSLSGWPHSLLAESLRSFDLSRKIARDSVRRVVDQILGSYLLSCMAFSVLIRSRSRNLSVAKLVYLRFPEA